MSLAVAVVAAAYTLEPRGQQVHLPQTVSWTDCPRSLHYWQSIITVFFDTEEGFVVCVNIASATQIIRNMHAHWQVTHRCQRCWWTSHENVSFINKLIYCKWRNEMSSTQSWSIKLCSNAVLATRKVHSLQKSAENHKKAVSKHTFANKTIDKQIRGVYRSRNSHDWHMSHSRLIVEWISSE